MPIALDPVAEQIGIGGCVAVLMTAAVLKFLPSFMRALKEQSNNNKGHKSGDLTPIEWEGRIRKIATEANEQMSEELMKDVRALMDSRGDKLREIIRQELDNRRR